ncbi:MAG TPA: hypothetical protein VLM37_13250 [Fibrobacteraceae bacterium]|nr:hypothetical protein [Fibrobacteraceae bacterium]
MQSPYEAFPYSVDALCLHIERVTGTPFNQVRQKRQINYLNNYLQYWEPNQDSTKPSHLRVLVEHGYVDQHYLEDHSQYFIRCFRQYPKECIRFHFFEKETIDSLQLREFLSQGISDEKQKKLNEAYLGFVVIRPIPCTFIARACLRPYERLGNGNRSFLIQRAYEANLYGIKLSIHSVAFQEQDRVLSACATSALWTFFHAHKCISYQQRPSAITITKSAYPEDSGMDAQFPNGGLTAEMMCRTIRMRGLEPRLIATSRKSTGDISDYSDLVEHIYAYCSGDQPVLMGVSVTEKTTPKGEHAVTILGFGLDETVQHNNPNHTFHLKAHRISKLYIHDDRTGPFARLKFKNNQWELGIDNPVAADITFNEESYQPADLVLGLYHKIRIHYTRIRETCSSFVRRIENIIDDQSKDDQSEQSRYTPEEKDLLKKFISDWEWDISIQEVNAVKKRLLGSTILSPSKESCLTRCFPKYIWSSRVSDEKGLLFEFLFDATDIPQGDVFLETILYDTKVRTIFDSFSDYCVKQRAHFRNQNDFEGVARDHLWGMIAYYSHKKTYTETLDGQFGMTKCPPYIKSREREQDTIRDQEAWVLYSTDPDVLLTQGIKYIWAINQDGGLVFGQESLNELDDFGGHPTLTQGAPARIAGELEYKDGKWHINSRSGRYSYSYSDEERQLYLNNVKTKRFDLFFRQYDFVVDEPHPHI